MHTTTAGALPAHLSIDLSSQIPHDVWAAFCTRCTGNRIKVSDGHRHPEDAAHAAREHDSIQHPTGPADWLSAQQQEQAAALDFSRAEHLALDAARDAELYEDPKGFFRFSALTDSARPVAGKRAVNLVMLGYLDPAVDSETRRRFTLSPKGKAALALWETAMRQRMVDFAQHETGHGMTPTKRSVYPLLRDGHPADAITRLFPSPARALPDTTTAARGAVGAWADDGGAFLGAPVPQPAAATHPQNAEAFAHVAHQAAQLAVQAADEAMHAAARASVDRAARLEERMHAAHAEATEAERHAHSAAQSAQDGQTETVRGLARRAVCRAVSAQQKAGVECSAHGLLPRLERAFSAAERRDAERAEREQAAQIEAEMRAATGMDEENRIRMYVAQATAGDAVPELGWSAGMLRAMTVAEEGRLYRRDGFTWRARTPGVWEGGRKVAKERVRMLADAGFLAVGRGTDPQVTLTPMGAVALYLARLHPQGIHADDRAARLARWEAARRPGRNKEDTEDAARRLPRLDRHTLRLFVRPVTLAEQAKRETEAAVRAWEDDGGPVPGVPTPRPAPADEPEKARDGLGHRRVTGHDGAVHEGLFNAHTGFLIELACAAGRYQVVHPYERLDPARLTEAPLSCTGCVQANAPGAPARAHAGRRTRVHADAVLARADRRGYLPPMGDEGLRQAFAALELEDTPGRNLYPLVRQHLDVALTDRALTPPPVGTPEILVQYDRYTGGTVQAPVGVGDRLLRNGIASGFWPIGEVTAIEQRADGVRVTVRETSGYTLDWRTEDMHQWWMMLDRAGVASR